MNGHPYNRGARLFNAITTTEVHAKNGTQADAPQNLTAPVDTTLYQTPTLSFGDIGTTTETLSDGWANELHGVGHFENTRLLERICLVDDFTWSTGDLATSPTTAPGLQKVFLDVDLALRNIARNLDVMQQFVLYRSNVEVTIRLNSNQFYYGALMVTLFPYGTGSRLDERSVLDPVVISASSAESTIKTWKWSYPIPWKRTDEAGSAAGHPVFLSIDVLAPLTIANPSMPTSITVQIWARFTEMELCYPTGSTSMIQAHSSKGAMPVVKYPKKDKTKHPAEDGNTVDTAITAISSITIGDAVSAISSLPDFVGENWGAITPLLGFFDKPDRDVPQTPIIIEPSVDLFNCDIGDSNVSTSLYKGRYVDPGSGRMPMTKNWTQSDYSRIPALRSIVYTMTAANTDTNPFLVPLISYHPDNTTMKTPLDYCCLASGMFRGSLKVCMQFFTSSFISARIIVQYGTRVSDSIDPVFPLDYTNGITRIINVKGDTVDTFTLPYLNDRYWANFGGATISYNSVINFYIDSVIATTNTTENPIIYCVLWVAGGDDVQFAMPVPVDSLFWSSIDTSLTSSDGRSEKGKEKLSHTVEKPNRSIGLKTFHKIEAHACVGSIFQQTFPPIGENCHYDIDRGFSTSEMIGPIVDVCKRYSSKPNITIGSSTTLPGLAMTNMELLDTTNAEYVSIRNTLWGTWRACFLFRSGGGRVRLYDDAFTPYRWTIRYNSVDLDIPYLSPTDGMSRLTLPQVMQYPFASLAYPVPQMSATAAPLPSFAASQVLYIAARDDLQFGYPILPAGYTGDLS